MKWFPFAEVVTDATSKFRKIKASDYQSEGQYKIIDQGKDAIAGYTNDETLINSDLLPIIIFGDHTRTLKYEDTPIALGADGAKALKVDSRIANALYVYYYLRSIKLKDAGYSRHFKFLKEIVIPIPVKDGEPNLDDQIRIAHLLGKVEGLIAQRKQHLQQLDDLLKSVFLEMFGDPVRNEKGWDADRIGRSIKVQGGFAFKSKDIANSGSIKLVKIANVHFEDLTWDDVSYVPDSFIDVYKKFALQEGDLLMALTRPVIKSLNVVKTATVRDDDLPCLLNQRVARFLIDKSQINKRFFLQYCYTEFFRNTVEGLCPPGLQPNVSTNQIEDIPFFYPPIGIQNEFAAIAVKVEGIKSRYQQSLTDLETLYGALSQQAFKGELDLSRVPLPRQAVETSDLTTQANMEPTTPTAFQLPEPEAPDWLAAENRQKLLEFWLTAWCERYAGEPFAASRFMDVAYQRLVELTARDAFQFDKPGKGFDEAKWHEEPAPFGINEYEKIKKWVFEALAFGKLTQGFDDADNLIQLKAVQA